MTASSVTSSIRSGKMANHPENIGFNRITAADDFALAALIRRTLTSYGLDRPGTAFADPSLDHLSRYYNAAPERRAYFVVTVDGIPVGGVGLAELPPLPGCAELQKLYLDERFRGRGLGARMLSMIEDEARRLGYRRIYLETHDALQAALRLYIRSGYADIPQPDFVVHSAMNRFMLKTLTSATREL